MNVATSLNSFTNMNFQVRFLTTIPSAAETSMLEEEAQSSSAVSPAKEQDVVEPFYAILHSPQASTTPIRRQSIITLHPASEVLNNNNDKKVLENCNNELTAINITNDRDKEINVNDVTKIDIMANDGICSENSVVGNSANDCSSSQKNGQVISEAGTSS